MTPTVDELVEAVHELEAARAAEAAALAKIEKLAGIPIAEARVGKRANDMPSPAMTAVRESGRRAAGGPIDDASSTGALPGVGLPGTVAPLREHDRRQVIAAAAEKRIGAPLRAHSVNGRRPRGQLVADVSRLVKEGITAPKALAERLGTSPTNIRNALRRVQKGPRA